MNKMKIRSVLAAVLVFALSTLQLSSTMFSMNAKADEMTNEVSSEVQSDEQTEASSEVTSDEQTEASSEDASDEQTEASSEDASDEQTESSSEATSEEGTTSEETSPEETVSEDDKVITNDENGIPDANLYAVLLNAGDKNHDGKLTVGEAKKISSLYSGNKFTDVKSFENLAKYAVNLNSIYSIDALQWSDDTIDSFCIEYSELNFLHDITIKTNNQKLFETVCSNTELTNLAFYSDYSNKLSNTEAIISKLPKLTSITSLQRVFNPDKLETETKERLTFLSVSTFYNGSIDLSEFKNLTTIALSGDIIEVKGLDKLKELTRCQIYNSDNKHITNIEGLKNLSTKLTSATFNGVNIGSIGTDTNLLDCSELRLLSIDSNALHDINGIEKLGKLETLRLYNGQLENIGKISELSNLTELALSGNKLSDVSGIEKLTNLNQLSLFNNKLTAIPDITGLTELCKLNASHGETLESKLSLSGNYLNKEDLINAVPADFAKNKLWLSSATERRIDIKDSKVFNSYYTYMDEEIMLAKMSSGNTLKNGSFTVATDCDVEVGTEFLNLITKNKVSVEIANINEQ